ncbi:MAG: TIM-barrel domain-containing protein [Bacteroidales bacterium]|jgi:oligosaccharide 4-alpha-D-glucosyltransferase|nr:DUF5110 domain-containing protein [Bacteroidales bacterium]MDD3701161.1 glycoside hydrolase family 31 protein [Bacteroidales bacterium]
MLLILRMRTRAHQSIGNILTFLALICLLAFSASAQEIVVRPTSPEMTDTITVSYDAAQGNRALADYDGTVYFHAGLITTQSLDGHDWRNSVGQWGTADARVRMQKAADNLYVASFVPDQLFQIAEGTQVQQIAFVFRNEDGTKVGKTASEEDIFIPVAGYQPPVAHTKVDLFDHLLFQGIEEHESFLLLQTDHGDITFRPFSDSIIETCWHPTGFTGFEVSHAVVMSPDPVKTFLAEAENQLIYDLPGIQVLIQKQPFHISYINNGKTILSEEKGFFARHDASGVRFRLEQDEKLYGSGGRAGGLNQRGKKLQLYNRPQYGYEIGADNLNYQIPLLVSDKKYILLIDNPHKAWLDVDSKEDNILEFNAQGGPMRYFLISGNRYTAILEQYSRLTGKQPMLPRWAFGNLQSRMAYRNQDETVRIVDQMIAGDFPIDAVIIDFYWFGDSILGHLGRFDWWHQAWPDPGKMIADFKAKGIQTITISEPYIIDSLHNWRIADSLGILVTDSAGKSYVDTHFYFGHGSLIDIFKPEARLWLWSQYRKQFDIGVEGLWGDLGEPESHPADIIHSWGKADAVHNIYGHYWTKAVYENFRKEFPDKRLFFLARSGFAGTQRYGIVPWSGDVSRSWGGLQAQLPAMLNMSLSGVPYMHSDAGGFAMGVKDEELYTRWLQFAVFTPVLRPHGSGIPSEPVFFNDTTQKIVRRFMKLRYELLPYLYTASWNNSISGRPIVAPVFFYHPDDERFASSFESFYFGPDILVAPVTHAGNRLMNIELPKGLWYHFWSGNKVVGGRQIQLQLSLETIPVFVREASIIPKVEAVNTTAQYSSRYLELHTYLPGYDGEFSGQMYEDDGQLFDSYGKGAYELIQINGKLENGSLSLQLSRSGKGYAAMPEARMIEFVLYGLEKNLRQLAHDDKVMEITKTAPPKNEPGVWKDQEGRWRIRVVWYGQTSEIQAR